MSVGHALNALLGVGKRFIFRVRMCTSVRSVMNKNQTVKIFDAQTLLTRLAEDKDGSNRGVKLTNKNRYGFTKKLEMFFEKGCKCVSCRKEGKFLVLEKQPTQAKPHLNLYAEDGTLMTIDHIVPKKHGGKDVKDNLQPMCFKCNVRKGSLIGNLSGINWSEINDDEMKVFRKRYGEIE